MKAGELIETRRKELGYSLEQLGKLVGVSKSTIDKWESGYISNMRRDKIAKLADALNVSPLDFIYDDGDRRKNRFASFYISPHEQTVITAYREQPEMQPAVDRLLNLTPKVVELRTAAGGGGVSADSVPLSVEDLARAQAAAEDARSDGE